MPAVSFIIPTYNGQALLQKNLASVLAAARAEDEVIVIDDASTDQTTQWLTQTYGLKPEQSDVEFEIFASWVKDTADRVKLRLIRNKHNLRFGASCNRAVSLAHHGYVFLINNDVQPTAEVLTHLLPHFEDPQVFAVGCHEIEEHQGKISGGKNVLYFARGMFIHNRAEEFSTGETAWASGGSAVFDKQKWSELGGFDPCYYPAYWEDTDLSFRAHQRGWKVMFEAQAVVYHNHETTNNTVFGQTKIEAISWRNARKFVWRNGTSAQKLQFIIWQPYWWLKRFLN